jgi:response regulator RpfG family c-di-GMP phosphodiesterase
MILLLSKNKILADSFVQDLKQEGFVIKNLRCFTNLPTVIRSLPDSKMIILDLESLGNISSKVFQELKSDPELKYMPLLCITRKDRVIEQLIAFELGADDFIYFPYNTIELQLKMRSVQGILDLQNQLKEKEGKIQALRETQKILVTLSHYINNSLTPLYTLVQFLDESNVREVIEVKETVTKTVEFIKRVLTTLNNFIQSGEYKVMREGTYQDLLIDIKKELEKLKEPAQL